MSASPSFSVVIPVFNNRETVVRAIESVLAQTDPASEILVIDDGSTDGSAALVQSCFGSQATVISFLQNRGPAAARNAGLEAAIGSHVAFLDADDCWHPEKLARMAAVLKARPEALLLFHDYSLAPQYPPVSGFRPYPLRGFLLRNPAATPCVVVRKTGLRFNEKLRWMEDYDFFLRHAEAGPVYYLPQALTVLGRPLLSAGGQSSRRWQMRKAEARVVVGFARRHPAYLPLLLLWLPGILAKHFYKEIKRF